MAFYISPGLVFLGGVANFFGSCLLPLAPLYIGYLGLQEEEKTGFLRGRLLLFVGGFLASFFLIGMGVQGSIGLLVHRRSIEILGGIVLLLLVLLSVRPFPAVNKNSSFLGGGGLLLGMIVGIIWTPCIGPIFGTVLFLAANTASRVQGGFLLLVYGIGMMLPLVIIGLGWQRFSHFLEQHKTQFLFLQRAIQVAVTILAVLLISGYYSYFSSLFTSLFSSYLPTLG
jgi:cytochrome c biogenesis protein CcdA